MKKILSILLAIVLVFSAVPMSGVADFLKNIDFSFLSVKCNAANESDLIFTLNDDENSYSVKAKNNNISGVIDIPAMYNEKPITAIGDRAFYGCDSLTSVSIPNGIVNIGSYAFGRCGNLTSISIPKTVRNINECAFSECTVLSEINVDSKNEMYCSSDGVLFSLGKETLICYPVGKSNSAYTIPNSVTAIDDYAFYTCYQLISVTIPNSVISIGESAFCDCNNLISIDITENLKNIGSSAFQGTAYYNKTTNWENGVLYLGKYLICVNNSKNGECVVRDEVKLIADSAFVNCTNVVSITIPNSVLYIGDYAFFCCKGLENVKLSENLTSLGVQAFYNCSNLTSVTISTAIKKIEKYTFSGCEKLKSITIPNNVTFIDSGAFEKCYSLSSAVLSENLDIISDYTFYGCKNLSDVSLPNKIKSIGYMAFCECYNLSNITLPENIKIIGFAAFRDCYSLDNIKIPESITNIGGSAFLNTAYYNNLENWDNDVLYIDDCLINVKNTNETFNIKEGTRVISSHSFSFCSNLKNIIIPTSIEYIDDYTFCYCDKLSSISIPDSVKYISDSAFKNCGNFVIYLFSNSYVLNYAVENSILYTVVDILPQKCLIDYTNKFCLFYNSKIQNIENDLLVASNYSSYITKYNENGFIGTGSVLTVGDNEYIISVSGDLDGDGVCDVLDAFSAEKFANSQGGTPTTAQIYAANGDIAETIDVTAYSNVVNKALL